MDSDKLNRWLTLGANLGVLVGIILLVIELNQSRDMMRAQTRAAVTESILTLLAMERDPYVVSAYRKLADGEELSFEEKYFMANMANATFRSWENSYYQNKSGLFEWGEFDAEIQVGREMIAEPHMAEHWSKNQQIYSKPFQDHVNNNLIRSKQ